MTQIFSQLGYNFNATKLGDANDPTGNRELELLKLKPTLHFWQYEALATNDLTGYMKNPVSNTIANLTSFVTSMNTIAFSTTFNYTGNTRICDTTKQMMAELSSFSAHTDRVSGVTATTSSTLPDFDTAIGVGELVISIVSVYDGVMNNTPILGSMTSLFIDEDLKANVITITSDSDTLNASIIGANSYITAGPYATICDNMNTVYSYISTRRTHDISFFNNCVTLMNNYQTISKYTSFDAFRLYMIQNYLGTDKLKNKL